MKIKLILNIIFLTILFFQNSTVTGKNIIENYEPKYWWTGMHYNNILIAIKGNNICNSFVKIDYPDVTFNRLIPTNNPNIAFVDIEISKNALAGEAPIKIYSLGKLQQTIYFTLKNRKFNSPSNLLTSSDVVYQIVIDRFKNGNYDNDKVSNYIEVPNRLNPNGIHGGDIDGIIKEMDYIKSIGATTIELSPIYESNQTTNSYYHDEITNHFQLDNHLGSPSTLDIFSQQCKSKNLKYIQSLVLHQASKNHWLFSEKLFNNWIYSPLDIAYPNVSISSESDPYSADNNYINQFYKRYPNLILINQESPIATKYLIQNTIWWIENCHPDGIKIEKTQFNKTSFLNKLFKSIKEQYPTINIVTDITTKQNDELAFLSNSYFPSQEGYNYDYPISYSLKDAFSEFISKSKGVTNLYEHLAKDFNYSSPNKHLVFINNNVTSRSFTLADRNIEQLKMMFIFWATIRGIPSIFYGSEILLEGNHQRGLGQSRTDFPGGWINDSENDFNGKSLSYEQKAFKRFITVLLKWRSSTPVIHTGKTKHFLLNEGLYVILRYNNDENILIIYNNNTNSEKINISDCSKELSSFTKAVNPIDNAEFTDLKNLIIKSKSATILKLE